MITIYFGENPYQFPNSWEELTPGQYLILVSLLGRFWAGELSVSELRVEFFKHLAVIENIRIPSRARERFLDNVLTASRQFDFFLTLDYGDKISDLSAPVRKQLRKTPPDEILSESSEIRYARGLDYEYQLDAVWMKNLFPEIELKDRKLQGWRAQLEGGTLTTSMTSYQYAQGYDLLSAIGSGGSRHTMALLVGLLYGADTNDTILIQEIEQLSDNLLQGVIMNFQAFITFMFTRTPFSILWNSAPDKSKKKQSISTSMSDSLYGLCKDGYGDYTKVEQMPLMTYLGITRTNLITSIRSMVDSGISESEIATRLNLSINQIEKILC